MSKSTKTNDTPKVEKSGTQLHIKESAQKLFEFFMGLVTGISAFILYTSGNTQNIKVLGLLLAIDAARHAYRLVVVIK